MSAVADEHTNAEIPEELAERLRDPQVAAQLSQVIDKLDVIVLALNSLDGLLAHSETIFDSVVASAKDAVATADGSPDLRGIDVKASADAGAQLVGALPRMTPALLRGVDSGAIDELTSPALVKVLHLFSAGAGAALDDPSPVQINGAMSVLRALKDPDTAKGLSFFVTVARAVGRQLPHNANK